MLLYFGHLWIVPKYLPVPPMVHFLDARLDEVGVNNLINWLKENENWRKDV